MTEQMKPCPFCGGKTIDYESPFTICEDCLMENWTMDWNTRPLEDALQAKVDGLLEACNEVLRFRRGEGKYDYTALSLYDATNQCNDDWQKIEDQLSLAIAKAYGKN